MIRHSIPDAGAAVATPSPALRASDARFIDFAAACTDAAGTPDAQARVAGLTRDLVQSGWRMPDPRYLQCQPDAAYGSYLLYLSHSADLCIVLDVFLAGQAAIAHNHLCWCVFTCLEGVERESVFDVPDDLSAPPAALATRLRHPGEVTLADAAPNAFHQVECEQGDRAVSLHIYGADIGALERRMWHDAEAAYIPFRSGYSNAAAGLPVYLSPPDAAVTR